MSINIHTIPFGMMVNTFLIRSQENCLLVDTGTPDSTGTFFDRLAEIGIEPDAIELIVLTHGHWDHIGSAKAIQERSGAKIAIHQREKGWLETGHTPTPPGLTLKGKLFGLLASLFSKHSSVPTARADIVLTDEDLDLGDYGIPGKVVHTPGHTAGSVSVILDSGEAFVGDLAMSAKIMRLSPGVPIVGDDLDLVRQSWEKLLNLGASTIYPSHGKPFPSEVFQKILKSKKE